MQSDTMMYIYKLPKKLSDGYCFGGGKPIIFMNVDWMGSGGANRETIEEFIKGKQYYDASERYLVLSNDAEFTFTMEPIRGGLE